MIPFCEKEKPVIFERRCNKTDRLLMTLTENKELELKLGQ